MGFRMLKSWNFTGGLEETTRLYHSGIILPDARKYLSRENTRTPIEYLLQ